MIYSRSRLGEKLTHIRSRCGGSGELFNSERSQAKPQSTLMVEKMIGRRAGFRLRADDDRWYMTSAANRRLRWIESIIRLRSTVTGLIEHDDQQSAALEVVVLD